MHELRTVPVIRDFTLRFQQWSESHLLAACVTEGVTFDPATGLMRGECRCTCPEHGCADTAAARDRRVYACACCRDMGVVRVAASRDDPRFGRAQPCPGCHGPGTPARVADLRAASGLTDAQFAAGALTGLSADSGARAGAERWLAEARRVQPFLVLTGAFGTGKTHAAIGVAARLIDEDVPVLFTTTRDLLSRLRASYDADTATREGDVLRPLRAAGCLVLDDLGAERETEWTTEKLLDLVDHRQRCGLLTVITTNLDPRTLSPTRLTSRVFGARSSYVVRTFGRDHRMSL